MTAYLVFRASGTYDDYHIWIERGFINEENANKFVIKLNNKIKRIKELAIEVQPKDEDGDFDDSHPNWMRYYKISELGNAWIKSIELL